MNNTQRIVIIGATSSIAEHCARLWVQNQIVHFTLVGRDASRLERVADDLKVRNPKTQIQTIQTSFVDPTIIQQTVDQILSQGTVDLVLIAHGSLPEQLACQDDLVTCYNALNINGISPALYAEAFAKNMAKINYGTIAIIGSVAGDRGRKSNYIYGSAKSLVSSYAQGLQHRFAGTAVKIILLKPGPTDTPMTANLKTQGMKLAKVEHVAQNITQSIQDGKTVAYTPKKWQIIMYIIKRIPNCFFNKINI